MATKARLSNGRTITVDNSQIDVKFTRNTEQLNASLSKAQKTLGLYYDGQNKLVDVLGRCVEGLSLSQIRLGMWVDDAGRARTISGGYAEGLSRVQLELGQYADELGNVRNIQGEVIGKTKEAIKADEARAAALESQLEAQKRAENELFEAQQSARGALGEAAGAVASSSSQFATLLAILDDTNEATGATRRGFIQIAEGASVAAATAQTAFTAYKGWSEIQKNGAVIFSNFSANINKAGAAWTAYRAGTLGAAAATKTALAAIAPAAVVLGAVSLGIGAAFMSGKKKPESIDAASSSFQELEKRAKEANAAIITIGDALKFGAFRNVGTELEESARKLEASTEKLKEARATFEEMQRRQNEVRRTGGTGAGFSVDMGADEVEKAKSEWQKSAAEYNAIAEKLINDARESQKTQTQRLEEQKAAYNALLEYAKSDKGNAEARSIVEKQIAKIDDEIRQARDAENRAAKEAANKSRDELAKETGLTFEKVETAQEELARTLEKLTKAKGAEVLSDEEFLRAQEDARARYLSQLEKEIGVSFAKPETDDPLEKFRAQTSRLDEELKSGRIDQTAYDAAKANAQTVARDALGLEVPKIAPTGDVPKFDTANFATLDAAKTADAINAATAAIKANAEKILANADAVSSDAYRKAEQEAAKALEAGTIDARTYARQIADAANATAKAASLAPEAFQAYKEEVDKATRAAESGVISEQEKNAIIADAGDALAKARKEAADAERDAATSRLGIDALISEADAINDAKKGVAQRLKEQEAAIKQARDAGEIADADFLRAQKALTTIRNKQADEERANAKEKARSALGIDSLMESMKTPFDNFAETMKKIDAAMASGAIDRNEANLLQWKARGDLIEKSSEKADKAETLKASTNENLAQTLRAGSNELYLAQVRNATTYQTSIKNATERLDQTTQASLEQTRLSNYWLEQMASSSAPIFYGA